MLFLEPLLWRSGLHKCLVSMGSGDSQAGFSHYPESPTTHYRKGALFCTFFTSLHFGGLYISICIALKVITNLYLFRSSSLRVPLWPWRKPYCKGGTIKKSVSMYLKFLFSFKLLCGCGLARKYAIPTIKDEELCRLKSIT